MRRYNDTTPEDEKRPEAAAHAMKVGAKERTAKLVVKMHKLLAVANPANGEPFLKEVRLVLKLTKRECCLIVLHFTCID